MEYKTSHHSVYLLTYHVVFVTKYRKPCITDEIGDFMKEYAAYLLEKQGGKLISAKTDKDHMHILMELLPSTAPADAVKILKTMLSKECHRRYGDEIEKYIYGKNSPLWSPSYFIATTGTTVMEKVRDYINSQRTDDHKRKYEKTGRYSKKTPKT